jgi:hypothetical protein
LQPGELLWMEIQRCSAQRFQVFAFTNALFVFPLEAYEHRLESTNERGYARRAMTSERDAPGAPAKVR